jgi:2-polyprenyl-6-methoxyphenol hydroxylase-like FAD-dependent oxidoreductase
MSSTYDAIIVGARCAGSPLAMLLAHTGYRVLLVDRATFPADTVSTHLVHPSGIAALSRWGLLERLVATDCPPIDTYTFDFGAFTIAGAPGTEESPAAYCPRRTTLDKILVDAASAAGAEVREGFTVDALTTENGRVVGIKGHAKHGATISERARVVVGADGRHSFVARQVERRQYNDRPALLCGYYAYWSGLPMHGRFETYVRPRRGFAAAPTNDDLTMIVAGWPMAEFEQNKKDVERNYVKTLELAPEFAARLRGARRESKIVGATVPNYFRKPYGSGWVLIGDAGYNRDFITAQGITDAFLDAERCGRALDEAFLETTSYDDAMAGYQRDRDARVLSMYEFTCETATLEPPPPRTQELLRAVFGNKRAMDAFVRMNAGTISPAQFFAPDHVAEIMAAARPPSSSIPATRPSPRR